MSDETEKPIKLVLNCVDRKEAKQYLSAQDYSLAFWDLDQWLRQIVKYGNLDGKEATEAEQAMADKVRDKVREILQDYDLALD